MAKKRKDLPANADVNPKTDDNRYRQQEEFDNERGRTGQDRDSEVRNTRETERLRDSQQGDERNLPETKKKQSPEDYRVDRKLPQIKK
jgi:hypothetical protein